MTGMTVQVKICGLTRASDAAAAESAGASYGGVILAPGSPRTVGPERVESLFAGSALARCGVFVDEPPERLLRLAGSLALAVVQLHGDEPPALVERVRRESGAEVWKAIRPRTAADFLYEVARYAGVADGLLLDGWAAGARGGTGVRFPWAEVARHRDRLDTGTRLIAAGGLTPDNVAEVIALLRPDVVDVSSGVEFAPGIKDPEAIRKFADAALAAPAQRGAI